MGLSFQPTEARLDEVIALRERERRALGTSPGARFTRCLGQTGMALGGYTDFDHQVAATIYCFNVIKLENQLVVKGYTTR